MPLTRPTDPTVFPNGVTGHRCATPAQRVQGWYPGTDGAGRAAEAIRRYLAERGGQRSAT